jgi:hypothetical protein
LLKRKENGGNNGFMLVGIYDMDYYANKKTWNYICMKLSSYHKQRFDKVTLFSDKFDLTFAYDVIYVCKADNSPLQPTTDMIVNSKYKFIGNFGGWVIPYKVPDIVWACRPDYSLYPFWNTKKYHDEAYQFFGADNKFLPIRQRPDNAFKNKQTLVIDNRFWYADKKDILAALSFLKTKKNIAFFFPIRIDSLIFDKEVGDAFLQLNFRRGTEFVWTTNWSIQNGESFMAFSDFIARLKEKTKASLGTLIWEIPSAYEIPPNDLVDFVAWGRANRLFIQIESLEKSSNLIRNSIIEWAARKDRRESYYDFILKPITDKYHCLPIVAESKLSENNAVVKRELEIAKSWNNSSIYIKWGNAID